MLLFMFTEQGGIPSQAPLMLFFLQLSVTAFFSFFLFLHMAKLNVSTLFQKDGKWCIFSSNPALVVVCQGSVSTID